MKYIVPEVFGSEQRIVGPAPVLVGPYLPLKESKMALALSGPSSITGSNRAYYVSNTPWVVSVTRVPHPILV